MNVTTGSSNLSSDCNRRVTIEVLGGGNQEPTRKGTYTITVPYSSFSKTLQGISRRGGTVIGIEATTSQADIAGMAQPRARSGRANKANKRQKRGITGLTRRQNTRSTRRQNTKIQRQNTKASADQPLSETFLKRLFSSK